MISANHTMVIYIQHKFHEIPSVGYLVMAGDGRLKDGRMDGQRQTYIPWPLAGDNYMMNFQRIKHMNLGTYIAVLSNEGSGEHKQFDILSGLVWVQTVCKSYQ